jgi:hypothetical protein
MKRWQVVILRSIAAATLTVAGLVSAPSSALAHDSVQGCEVSQNGNNAHFHCWSPDHWTLRRSVVCLHQFVPALSYEKVHIHTFTNQERHHNIDLSCPKSFFWITNTPAWRFYT